jgi:hypothetical protein
METIAFFWIAFAIIVGVAANTRGRNGGGWFILAVLISPLLAGLLVLALPRKEKPPPGHGIYFSEILGGGKQKEARLAREQTEKDRREGVFRPDGMIGDTPYHVLPSGETEAMVQGGIVRFQSLDQLRSMMNVKGPSEDIQKAVSKEPEESNLDFQQEVDGVPYILNSDSTVIAKTPIGVHTYGSWAAFRQATKKRRWR